MHSRMLLVYAVGSKGKPSKLKYVYYQILFTNGKELIFVSWHNYFIINIVIITVYTVYTLCILYKRPSDGVYVL